MEFNKSLLIAALSLLAASGLFAKEIAKKDKVPGVAPQPASFFYTGKPYDSDLGAYTFNFRSFDPSLARWTSADPSGFPEGANGYRYVSNRVLTMFDDLGLTGKSVLWLIGEASSDSSAQQMQSAFDIVKQSMTDSDTQTKNTSNATHYLDDNDKFDVKFITSLAELNQIAGYTKVYYVAHGDTNGGVYLGDTLYQTSTIKSHCSLICDVQGCINETTTTAKIVLGDNGQGDTSGWSFETMKYLRE